MYVGHRRDLRVRLGGQASEQGRRGLRRRSAGFGEARALVVLCAANWVHEPGHRRAVRLHGEG